RRPPSHRSRACRTCRGADAGASGGALRFLRVILHRCFAWNPAARDDATDGPLWFPRTYQGEGRHDTPDTYGCLYLADRPVSCLGEHPGPFRGQPLVASLLRRRALPLALADIELDDNA